MKQVVLGCLERRHQCITSRGRNHYTANNVTEWNAIFQKKSIINAPILNWESWQKHFAAEVSTAILAGEIRPDVGLRNFTFHAALHYLDGAGK